MRADLSSADFSGGADLRAANLIQANLTNANFAGADFSGASLMGADLSRADLTGATLKGSVLVGANLTDAILTGCKIFGVSAWNVILGEKTIHHGLIIDLSTQLHLNRYYYSDDSAQKASLFLRHCVLNSEKEIMSQSCSISTFRIYVILQRRVRCWPA